MNNIDPNWFFSATAQSFAAIVAIVGGFILNKFISLSIEKKNYILKKENLENKLNNKKENYTPEIKNWLQYFKWGLSSHRCQKVFENNNINLDTFFNKIDIISPYQVFEKKIKALLESIQFSEDFNNIIRNVKNVYKHEYNFMDKETNLRISIKEIKDLQEEINQYEREIEAIQEDKSIKKGYKTLLALFISGVSVPLIMLILNSIYKTDLYCIISYSNFCYISYSITIVAICISLLITFFYFRSILK